MRMHRLFVFCLLALGALAQTSTSSPEAKIRQLEDKYYSAFEAGRWDELASLESDDFIVVSGTATKKAQQVEDLKKSKPLQQKFEMSDRQFQKYGDVVVVSYTATTSGGNEKPHKFAVSEVWHKTGNDWKIANLHYSDAESETAAGKQ